MLQQSTAVHQSYQCDLYRGKCNTAGKNKVCEHNSSEKYLYVCELLKYRPLLYLKILLACLMT